MEEVNMGKDESFYTIDDVIRRLHSLKSRSRCPLYGVSGSTTIQELFSDNVE